MSTGFGEGVRPWRCVWPKGLGVEEVEGRGRMMAESREESLERRGRVERVWVVARRKVVQMQW